MDQLYFKNSQFTGEEIKAVAALHKNTIEKGCLSFMSEKLLEKLYSSLEQNKDSVLILAIKNEKVAGFICGVLSKRQVFKTLFKTQGFKLIPLLFPDMFSLQTINKLNELIVYSWKSYRKKKLGVSAELLSLALDEKFREQGIAQILFHQLTGAFDQRGIRAFKIAVNDSLIPAQCFYEKVGAQRHWRLDLYKGETSLIYVFDIKTYAKEGHEEPGYVRRYSALLQKLDQPAIILDGVLWTAYQKMVVPVGPACADFSQSSAEYQEELLRLFKGCVLLRAGSGFVSSPENWYAVISDRFVDLDELSLKSRAQVRRGLRNCTVRRMDARFLADHGWPVITAAYKRYKIRMTETENQFRRKILLTEGFEDIVHYWGAFEKDSERLIAYAQNYVYDKKEVNYWIIHFHPDFLRLNTSHALLYEMNRYYLGEEKFACANNGFRNLLHQTGIQDYLINKFNYKKQPVGLKVFYRPAVSQCVTATYPCRRLLGAVYPPLGALYKLEEMRRSSVNSGNKDEKEFRLV